MARALTEAECPTYSRLHSPEAISQNLIPPVRSPVIRWFPPGVVMTERTQQGWPRKERLGSAGGEPDMADRACWGTFEQRAVIELEQWFSWVSRSPLRRYIATGYREPPTLLQRERTLLACEAHKRSGVRLRPGLNQTCRSLSRQHTPRRVPLA
jgi:hypothetical protein